MAASYVMSWVVTVADPPEGVTDDVLANAFMGECESHFGEAMAVGGHIITLGGGIVRVSDSVLR